MKTILCISPYYKEEHRWMVSTVKLAQLWQKMGYKVVVVCMHSITGIIEQTDTLVVYGYKDFFIKDPFNFGIALGFSRYVRECIVQYSPDILLINKVLFWSSWSIFSLRLHGYKPVVLTDALVGITWWPRAWYMKIIMAIGGTTIGLCTLWCAKRIVFFHPQPKQVLRLLGIEKKSLVIPTGIDTAQYTYSSSSDLDTITITYIGRLESVKGVDDFCAAFVEVQKQYPNVIGQVVGKYSVNAPLYKQYAGQLQFTGLVQDVRTALQHTDIFVLPSYSEGLSNALMEAMCSGCTCIATNVGGNTFLLNNGECGLLFTPGDRTKLIEHITQCIKNTGQRIALAKAARARIENFFDWSIVQKEYSQLFSEIL